MRKLLLSFLAGAAGLLPGPLAAQADAGQRCRLQILNVDREGTQVEVSPGVVNYFAGGNVRLRCVALEVFMSADSVASYQGRVVQFVGRVRYRDSTVQMTADYGTYFRDTEKWEARGNVVLRNLRDSTTLRGPMLDYYRVVPGLPNRDVTEMYADQRPTISVPASDSVGRPEEPYLVVGDRVRARGEQQVWAGGRVTIDRSDFRGRGDSLLLDTGDGNRGALVGMASMRRTAADSFDLTGQRIDLGLDQGEVRQVTASDSATLVTGELRMEGDSIGIALENREVERTTGWGRVLRPVAVTPDFHARGDSLVFDTPGGRLREIRAFGKAWLGMAPDSMGSDRDWVAGDSVTAAFVERDSAGTGRTALQRLEARGNAQAFYRMATPGPAALAGSSLSYTVASMIVVTMLVGDTTGVDSVFALGVKDGLHLQPGLIRPTASDTTPPPTRPASSPVPGLPREERRRQ